MPLNEDYHYHYEVWRQFGSWTHAWIIEGPHGAIHFHVTEYEKERYPSVDTTAGLECHYRTPPSYMKDRAPHHPQCQILHAPCWHDGTSLYAQEALLPRVDMREPLRVFDWLVSEMHRFDEEDVDA